MTGNDMTPPAFSPRLSDLALALGLLTRLPLPTSVFPSDSARPAAHAAWAYPLAGAVVAMIALLVGSAAMILGLPPAAAALLTLLAGTIVTGAMHEDGLADCADGFWGGWTKERRLEIMKDSQIGTYGVIALIALLVGSAAMILGLPPAAAALLALLAGTIVTGAMHEDGLADCADGFWGGWTKERRLEIMKDSQIGTYGVIALIASFGLRWIALTLLFEAQTMLVMIGAAMVSRAAMVAVMSLLPHARSTGLSHLTGAPTRSVALLAGGLGIAAAFVLLPMAFGVLLMVATLSASWMAIARAKIGGQTGDVLGATQQLSEIVVLLACAAALT